MSIPEVEAGVSPCSLGSVPPGPRFSLIPFKVEHWASMVLGLNTAPSITMATGENQEARKGGCFSTGLAVHLLQSLEPACCVWELGPAEVQSGPSPMQRVVSREGRAVTCGVRTQAGLCLEK